jgi:hypothetical protein
VIAEPALPRDSTPARWPGPLSILSAAGAGAIAVAVDAYYSAQEGYLSRAPDYDGVSYLTTSRSVYDLLVGGHLRTALAELNSSLAPLWIAALDFQQLILGRGTWQAFTARFWAVAPLLLLVYWIARRRAGWAPAVAAMCLTAVLPVASAAVRASSLEFVTGQANYGEIWSLEDLRPDFFAIVLVLWSIAPLAEHHAAPRRSTFIVSGAFAAAAVLAKPSTAPVSLLTWGLTLLVVALWNRRRAGTLPAAALGVATCAVLLLPWAIKGGVSNTVSRYFEIAVTYHANYDLGLNLQQTITYYVVRLPEVLGQLEVWVVAAAAIAFVASPYRRRLARADWIYLGVFLLHYAAFTAISNKNTLVGFWVALPLWVFAVAAAAQVLGSYRPALPRRVAPAVLGATAAYLAAVYAVGAVALAAWPADEHRSNQQLLAVSSQLAAEIGRHVRPNECFAYAPGPGWPASLEYLMTDSRGRAPSSTPVDVDPSMPVADYVRLASRCPAVIVYREDIAVVARMFVAYPVRQPYLRAVAEWVRNPDSGYTLDRSWQFIDLASNGPHALGRYDGIDLTVDLYVRGKAG